MPKARVSIQRRKRLLEQFKRSPLSAAAFTRKHGINYSTFCLWRKRECHSKTGVKPTLVEVEVDTSSGKGLDIWIGSQCRLEVKGLQQVKLAAAIIQELEAARC